MNRRALAWLIAVVLLTTAGCSPPRHPPHTPQPFGMEEMTGSSSSSAIPPL